jgi:hypothetical protein
MRNLIAVVCGLFLGIARLSGHHAFSAFYHEEQSVTLEGQIVEFEYVNPHAWVHFHSRDNAGQVQKVSAEWANPSRLAQQGVAKDTLKPGNRVIVTGSPSRDPSEYKLHLKAIQRLADGWKWSGPRGERR